MKFYNFSEAKQNFTTILNTALSEDVIITGDDGSKFKLISIDPAQEEQKSPLEDIEGIKTNITMKEILAAIKQRNDNIE
ncbi:MAG: type II toxin-antitoxin system Phd/YefM family antitoxin [Lactobacillales bacterium]|jgi:hypothetical protein|nr:type II toxin-antitoxin system Phd/YefM family antitoxin [Lactobacillales bacterium]